MLYIIDKMQYYIKKGVPLPIKGGAIKFQPNARYTSPIPFAAPVWDPMSLR